MWDFLGKLVDALPAWFLVVLVTALLAAAAWIAPRLRRDKNGRPYIYSRSYEHQKNRQKALNSTIQGVKTALTGLEEKTKSVECENLKQSFYIDNEAFPKSERLIAGLKYVYAGGNGAMREDVARFVKENPDVYAEAIRLFPRWALREGE